MLFKSDQTRWIKNRLVYRSNKEIELVSEQTTQHNKKKSEIEIKKQAIEPNL